MGFVFSIFMLMMLSAIYTTSRSEGTVELAKFIHLVQFLLPSFALVLGSLYLRPASIYLSIEAIVLYILAIIIPLEVLATISHGHILSSRLYGFSLYQHFQYLPVVFLGFYFFAAASFYKSSYLRHIVLFLAPWMGVYIAQSLSITAIGLAIYGSIVLVWLVGKKNAFRYALSLLILALITYLIYAPFARSTAAYSGKFIEDSRVELIGGKFIEDSRSELIGEVIDIDELRTTEKFDQNSQSGTTGEVIDIVKFGTTDRLLEDKMNRSNLQLLLPKNMRKRLSYWYFYGFAMLESPEVFAFGHNSRPDRNKYPSAHNYYLDLIYNFGAISLLPFAYLIFVSIKRCSSVITNRKASPDVVMLAALVAFFVFIDNFLKVGFGQPYPGMMMFFFWGLLFARVSGHENANSRNFG